MAREVSEIEKDIQALSADERRELLRALIADLDTLADPDAQRAWLEAAQRRHNELVEGSVRGVPGAIVFERLRSRLGQ